MNWSSFIEGKEMSKSWQHQAIAIMRQERDIFASAFRETGKMV